VEARARDLLHQPLAWPLARAIHRQQRFSRAHLPLDTQKRRIDKFYVFVAHDFQPDRLTAWLETHSSFKETYARGFRVKTDNEIPGDVLEAIQHEHMPQFNLRNIGRAERSVDLDDPLPLQRQKGIGGQLGQELDEVREAHVPKPQMAEVWSVRLMGRVRGSLQRILLEDPWELRLGPDATSGQEGPGYRFVVEGTHPHDLPDAWWGPEPVPLPENRVAAPQGEEQTPDLMAYMREMTK
jgi:hypothetical protein